MLNVESEEQEIDLTRLRKYAGNIIDGKPIELELIALYKHKYSEEENVVSKFTSKVLYELYGDNKVRSYADIYKFVPKAKYNHMIINFINLLEISILNKIKPHPLDIVFIKYTCNTEDSLKAIFRIDYLKEVPVGNRSTAKSTR